MTHTRTRRAIGVAALGAQATIAQIVVVRSGLERFGGNEFFIGVALATWLISGAVGAGLFGRLADVPSRRGVLIRTGTRLTAAGTLLALFVLNFLATRIQTAGITPHPAAAAGWIALATVWPGAASGVLFAWLVPVLSDEFGTGLGRVTLFESGGAAVGGLILGTLMPDITGSPGLVACVVIFAGAAIHLIVPPVGRFRLAGVWIFTGVVTVGAVWITMALAPIPPDFSKIETLENRRGRFVAVSRHDQITILSGSRTLVDCQDERTPELVAATVVALSPNATDIAAAGGSGRDLTTLAGIHDTQVTFITPDPQLDAMTARLCKTASGPARITDTAMHHFSRSDKRHDIILLRTGFPDTIDRAGLLSVQGLSAVKHGMTDDGLLAASLGPVQPYPTDAALRVLARILDAGRRVFHECAILPIGNYWLVCGQNLPDATKIIEGAAALPFEAKYATRAFFADALNPFNIKRLSERITAAAEVHKNPVAISDSLEPIVVLDAMLDWAGLHTPAAATARFEPSPTVALTTVAALPLLLLLVLVTGLLKRRALMTTTTVAVTGAAGLVVELAMMWAVQSAYGSLHFWLAALIAVYMAGLGAGAWAARRTGETRGHDNILRISLWAQAVLTIAAIGVCVVVTSGLSNPVGLPLAILVLGFCAAASGAAFQAAAQIARTATETGTARLVASLRAIDTAAAAVAAILCSFFLLPVAGTPAVLTACALCCGILTVRRHS